MVSRASYKLLYFVDGIFDLHRRMKRIAVVRNAYYQRNKGLITVIVSLIIILMKSSNWINQ